MILTKQKKKKMAIERCKLDKIKIVAATIALRIHIFIIKVL